MRRFLKQNPEPGSDRLIREAQGLEMLERALRAGQISELRVPARLSLSRDQLELERIAQHTATDAQMRQLGRGLARLHNLSGDAFGLEHDNYIGLSPQKNGWSHNWGAFFADRRLSFQIERIEREDIRQRFSADLARCRESLIGFLNRSVDGPSLVHGDLWSGNVLFDSRGAWLIDPAVYYADAEVDLAMSEMFGGFSGGFYHGYEEVRPLTPDYPLKRRLYNLYHYLNHYNLFGSSYLRGCEEGFAALDETLYR